MPHPTPRAADSGAGGAAMVGAGCAGAGDAGLEHLLRQFLASIIALAGARAGAARVLTDDGAQMRLLAQIGMPDSVLASELLVDRHCGACALALDAPALQWLDDVQSCQRHTQGQPLGPPGTRMLAMALRHDSRVLGVYNLFFDPGVSINPQIGAVLTPIGQLLGLALHNARAEQERLRTTVMHERQALVHEVHDAIAQTLVYARMRLPLLRDAMQAHDDQRSLKYLADVSDSLTQVHDKVREVMTFFHTRMDPLGLLHAVQVIAASFHDRTGIALEVENTAGSLGLSQAQEVQVLHIMEEALANIAKHSSARRARLVIRRVAGALEVLIEDDGAGMVDPALAAAPPVSGAPAHFGLEIMKGRAERLGGSLEVGNIAGGGTRVRLLVPAPAVGALESVPRDHPKVLA